MIDNVAYQLGDAETLLSILRGRLGHYIVTSTAFVYPGVEQAAKSPPSPLRERDWPAGGLSQDPDDPSPHGRYVPGKRRLERRLLELCLAWDLPLTIVRPPLQVIGPYADDARFAWFWLRMEDGEPRRSPRPGRPRITSD